MKKKLLLLLFMGCSVFLLTGCDWFKKSDSSKESTTKEESKSSTLAVDKKNSVVCLTSEELDYSFFRQLKDLVNESIPDDSLSLIDRDLKDRETIIGKRSRGKITIWNNDGSEIVEYYRTMKYEFNYPDVTDEMIKALEKELKEEIQSEESFSDSKTVIDGKTLYVEGQVKISVIADEGDTHMTKQQVYNNLNGDYYTCTIND